MAAIDFGSGPDTASGDTVAQALAKLQARVDAISTPTPAPAFTTQPTVSPGNGTVGQVFAATQGAASDTTSYAGQWMLNGVPISGATALSYTATSAGTLSYRSTATGPGGSIAATSAAATVSAAGATPTTYTPARVTAGFPSQTSIPLAAS